MFSNIYINPRLPYSGSCKTMKCTSNANTSKKVKKIKGNNKNGTATCFNFAFTQENANRSMAVPYYELPTATARVQAAKPTGTMLNGHSVD